MDTASSSTVLRALVNCLILLSAGSAAVHFAVIGGHFDEYWAFGLFFAFSAWLQILWAIALAGGVRRWLIIAGALGNGLIIAIWIVSRTTGLPVGPHAGSPEAVELIDVLATVFEALIVIGGLGALRRSAQRTRMGTRAVVVTTLAAALVVVPLTTAAIASVSVHKESDVFHDAPQQEFPHR